MRLQFWILVVTTLAFVSCGKKDSEAENKTQAFDALGNYHSGQCGTQVVSDYRAMREGCERHGFRSREQADSCKGLAQGFLGKYPGANCTASAEKDQRGRSRPFSITEREAREYLEQMKRMGL